LFGIQRPPDGLFVSGESSPQQRSLAGQRTTLFHVRGGQRE
jgi:hypothetical protein